MDGRMDAGARIRSGRGGGGISRIVEEMSQGSTVIVDIIVWPTAAAAASRLGGRYRYNSSSNGKKKKKKKKKKKRKKNEQVSIRMQMIISVERLGERASERLLPYFRWSRVSGWPPVGREFDTYLIIGFSIFKRRKKRKAKRNDDDDDECNEFSFGNDQNGAWWWWWWRVHIHILVASGQ